MHNPLTPPNSLGSYNFLLTSIVYIVIAWPRSLGSGKNRRRRGDSSRAWGPLEPLSM